MPGLLKTLVSNLRRVESKYKAIPLFYSEESLWKMELSR